MKTRLTWHSTRIFSDQHAGPYKIKGDSIYLMYSDHEEFLIPRSYITEEFYVQVFYEYKLRLFKDELSRLLKQDEDGGE